VDILWEALNSCFSTFLAGCIFRLWCRISKTRFRRASYLFCQTKKNCIILNYNTLKVLIFTSDISNNLEKLTIYACITVNGKRAEISLKRYALVNEWDENKGRLHGLTHKARLLNSYQDEVYGVCGTDNENH
jgi:hypothetical protein